MTPEDLAEHIGSGVDRHIDKAMQRFDEALIVTVGGVPVVVPERDGYRYMMVDTSTPAVHRVELETDDPFFDGARRCAGMKDPLGLAGDRQLCALHACECHGRGPLARAAHFGVDETEWQAEDQREDDCARLVDDGAA